MIKKFLIAVLLLCTFCWVAIRFSPSISEAQNATGSPSGSTSVSPSAGSSVSVPYAPAPTPAADEADYNKDPQYKEIGIHTGVWNDGQAALWDINAIDHFGIFGPPERRKGHRPEQPIHFSHVLHVQKNHMDCQFCHWSVAKASYAAIPEVENCMGCHKLVAGHSDRGKADIKYLKEMYEAGKPIPWIKVHVVPDHVKFNHKRHVKSGIPCSSCHGQVQEMPVVERVSSMKMGWCMESHRQKGASNDCMTCHGGK